MATKYHKEEIADIKDNTLLLAIKNLCAAALSIKDNLFVGDDGEWDYKLNKVLKPFSDEIKDLALIDIELDKNKYYGNLTVERLVQEFSDFFWLVSSTSPLGEDESNFVIAYEFLNNRTEEKKKYQSPSLRREYFWDDIHASIKTTSKARYESGHYIDATEAAFKEVIKRVKDYVNAKTGGGFDGDRAMNKAFGFENQEPLIKFNGLKSDEEKDEQKGIMNLFKGIVGIRNRKVHENITLDDPQQAKEYLALASLLMRLLDKHIDIQEKV
jgi:uncharacterized protein (TIGR02391 family)